MAYFGGDSRSARGIKPASVGETDAPEEVDEGHAGNGDDGVGKPAARAGRRGNIDQATGPFVGVASLTMLRTDRTASLAMRWLARKSVEPEIDRSGWNWISCKARRPPVVGGDPCPRQPSGRHRRGPS